MDCVAFHFLNHHVGRDIMAIFQVDNVKLHPAQIVKEWFGRKKNIDQKWMHLLIEINVVMVFSSRVASVFVQL